MVDANNIVLHCCMLHNILNYVERRLTRGQNLYWHTQEWNWPTNIPSNGPILFTKIEFMHHSYENIWQGLEMLE